MSKKPRPCSRCPFDPPRPARYSDLCGPCRNERRRELRRGAPKCSPGQRRAPAAPREPFEILIPTPATLRALRTLRELWESG